MKDTGEEKNTIKFRGLRRVCQVKKKKVGSNARK